MRALLMASLSAFAPAAAVAQDTAAPAADANLSNSANTDSMDTMGNSAVPTNDTLANDITLAQTAQPEREDDDDLPWGLLGLLGLAGLLGRKRHEDRHVHVDRPVGTINRTGTTTDHTDTTNDRI